MNSSKNMQSEKTKNFIESAIKKHGKRFDYSKVIYINTTTKIIIICKKHGEYLQSPRCHLCSKTGCKKCSMPNVVFSTKEFIERATGIYKDRYDYTKSNFIKNTKKIIITCKIHGDFEKDPPVFLKGVGCGKCNGTFMDTNFFIEKASKLHNNKYDYSKAEYKNSTTHIIIICPIHGDHLQNPHSHLCGYGCSKCTKSYMDTEYFIEKASKMPDNDFNNLFKNWGIKEGV